MGLEFDRLEVKCERCGFNYSALARKTSDGRLVTQLRQLVAAPVVVLETVESAIDRTALINTSTGFPIAGLRRVNILPDPRHPDEVLAPLQTTSAVAYWLRPFPENDSPEEADPRIAGIQISKDGTASVFFGIVTPP
jgi:hypothetical protein